MCNIHISNKYTFNFCKSWCLGKYQRLYAHLSSTIYNASVDLIYIDLRGPSPSPSDFYFNYYITFIDAYTKYTLVYFLKQKFESLNAFKLFNVFVHNQFKTMIKATQSKYEWEFRPLIKYLSELRISHSPTRPHTSHQNGRVEHKHRHIVEMRLTLLSHASKILRS